MKQNNFDFHDQHIKIVEKKNPPIKSPNFVLTSVIN